MLSRITLACASLLAIVGAGCGTDSAATPCTPGFNRACSCGDLPGSQACTADSTWSMCICDGAFDAGNVDAGNADAGSMDAAIDATTDIDLGADMNSVDGSALHAAVLATIPSLPVATIVIGGGGSGTPDFSCRRSWDQDAPGGASVTGNFNFDFGGALTTTVDVKIFPSNEIPLDYVCTGSCFTRPTDLGGSTATFTLESGRFTAWAAPAFTDSGAGQIIASNGYFYESDRFASSGVRETPPTVEEISAAYSRNSRIYSVNSSTLSSRVVDCQSRSVQGAVVRVFDEDGLRVPADSPPVIRYEQVTLAAMGTPTYTRSSGDVLAIDMYPSNSHGTMMRVEAWANLGSGTPELVACESVRIFGGAITTLRLKPIRSTSPSDCTP